MRSAICFLLHLATNTHVAPWLISTGCCKKGRAHPWVAVGSGDRSWAPSAPRDKSFARSSLLRSCLKAAEQRGRAPPHPHPHGHPEGPVRCRSCPAPGDQHSPRGATRSLCILPLSICRALSEARVVPRGEEGGGGRTPRFGVSERGFRTGSRHKHRSAAESISVLPPRWAARRGAAAGPGTQKQPGSTGICAASSFRSWSLHKTFHGSKIAPPFGLRRGFLAIFPP